jgi:hypothetical protein
MHLRALDENPVRYYDGYEEQAAKDGSFHFARVVPGAYRLETGTSGFVLPAHEPIVLRAGERRRGITISAEPSCALASGLGDPRRHFRRLPPDVVSQGVVIPQGTASYQTLRTQSGDHVESQDRVVLWKRETKKSAATDQVDQKNGSLTESVQDRVDIGVPMRASGVIHVTHC